MLPRGWKCDKIVVLSRHKARSAGVLMYYILYIVAEKSGETSLKV